MLTVSVSLTDTDLISLYQGAGMRIFRSTDSNIKNNVSYYNKFKKHATLQQHRSEKI